MVVVGGGVLGTMHALEARQRGHQVVHLEREAGPRGASVRNFGLVWVSGRADGAELALALRARERGSRSAREVPGVGFRARGSLTVAAPRPSWPSPTRLAPRPTPAARGFELLGPTRCGRSTRPCAATSSAGCSASRDGRRAAARRSARCGSTWRPTGGYTLLPGRRRSSRRGRRTRPHRRLAPRRPGRAGHRRDADRRRRAIAPVAAAPIRRCRLQMMQTAPLGEELTTSVADGDSFRYYPAYAARPLRPARPQPPSPPSTGCSC